MTLRAAYAGVAEPRNPLNAPSRAASTSLPTTSGSTLISSKPCRIRSTSSRNVSTSAMRSSFSGVFVNAFHGAEPRTLRKVHVPSAAAPARAATSHLPCRATPAKRVFGSRPSKLRRVLKVTLFCSPKPRAASAICSGVNAHSLAPRTNGNSSAARETGTTRTTVRASRCASRPARTGRGRPCLRCLAGASRRRRPWRCPLQARQLRAGWRSDVARRRLNEASPSRSDSLGVCESSLSRLRLSSANFGSAFDHFAKRPVLGQPLPGPLHRLLHLRGFVGCVGPREFLPYRAENPRWRRDMAENDGEFIVAEQAIMGRLAKDPWRQRLALRSSRLLLLEHSGAALARARLCRRPAARPALWSDRAHDLHALSAAPDDTPLAARSATRRALGFAGLVDKRRVETANPRADDPGSVAVRFRRRPIRRTQCRDQRQGRARRQLHATHGLYRLLTVSARCATLTLGNRLESHGKRTSLKFSKDYPQSGNRLRRFRSIRRLQVAVARAGRGAGAETSTAAYRRMAARLPPYLLAMIDHLRRTCISTKPCSAWPRAALSLLGISNSLLARKNSLFPRVGNLAARLWNPWPF